MPLDRSFDKEGCKGLCAGRCRGGFGYLETPATSIFQKCSHAAYGSQTRVAGSDLSECFVSCLECAELIVLPARCRHERKRGQAGAPVTVTGCCGGHIGWCQAPARNEWAGQVDEAAKAVYQRHCDRFSPSKLCDLLRGSKAHW